jgi:hypothetical protein
MIWLVVNQEMQQPVPTGHIIRSGIDAHLTPTKKKKKNTDGTDSNISHRGMQSLW